MEPEQEPNWVRIVASEVWREEIVPWLEQMRRSALEALSEAPEGDSSVAVKAEARCIRQLLLMPERMLEQEREARANAARRVEGSDGPRRRFGRQWLRRVVRPAEPTG